jgi:RNA polymerase sigma-70 factor (ECF subfamily)
MQPSPAHEAHAQSLDFAQLVNRVKAGDDSAMTQLTESLGPTMRRMARELIGKSLQSHLDSDDLVQSVQLVLWLGLRTGKFPFVSTENLFGLVRTLLRRQVARYCRSAKPHMSRTIDAKLGNTLADVNLWAVANDDEPAKATELDDLVEHFVSQLAELDQRLIKLRLQGFSTADAARRLRVDAGLLRVRLGRLRKRFADFRTELAKAPVAVPVIDSQA